MKIFKLFPIFLAKVNNKILTWISIKLEKNLTKPENVYFLITNKCNFKCLMCTQWQDGQTEDPKCYLALEQIKKVVDQMASWGVKNLGISGGETLIYRDKILAILEYANQKGLYTHFVTNGWLLDEQTIKNYDQIGGGHISLSLDAASQLHDELRGTAGAFEHVKQALQAFAGVKPKNILLKMNLVISNKNLNEILEVVKITRENKASIFLQPYDPYNWNNRKTLNLVGYREKYPLWIQADQTVKMKKVIAELIKIKRKEPSLIINSIEHLAAIPKYFLLELNRPYCHIAYRSLVINPNGEVTICKYGIMGNVIQEPIKQIWNNLKYQKVRKDSITCNFDCLLGCMYDPSIFSWIKSGLHLILKMAK